jgi:hypothetical protein
MRELMKMQAAGKFSLLEVRSNVLVRHFLHPGLEEIVLLQTCQLALGEAEGWLFTSSSDQDRFPPADILRARRLEGSGDCEFISGRGERTWGWW